MTTTTARLSLHHLTRIPAHAGEAHPTVICLHGRGSNEADLLGLAPYLDDGLLWISPRAPLELMGGFEWYRLEGIGVPLQSTFDAAVATLDRFVTEAVSAYPVDPARLYLMGFSQGSMMSYSFALTQPARVAGVMAQSGYIPLSSGLKVDEAGLKGKPFIVTHGAADPMIPVQWGREARDYLTRVGADVEYHEFPMGHSVSEESLAAIGAWMDKRLA
jgi:phospholipase/carboxylesterase